MNNAIKDFAAQIVDNTRAKMVRNIVFGPTHFMLFQRNSGEYFVVSSEQLVDPTDVVFYTGEQCFYKLKMFDI
jgi:hypothetical protein